MFLEEVDRLFRLWLTVGVRGMDRVEVVVGVRVLVVKVGVGVFGVEVEVMGERVESGVESRVVEVDVYIMKVEFEVEGALGRTKGVVGEVGVGVMGVEVAVGMVDAMEEEVGECREVEVWVLVEVELEVDVDVL